MKKALQVVNFVIAALSFSLGFIVLTTAIAMGLWEFAIKLSLLTAIGWAAGHYDVVGVFICKWKDIFKKDDPTAEIEQRCVEAWHELLGLNKDFLENHSYHEAVVAVSSMLGTIVLRTIKTPDEIDEFYQVLATTAKQELEKQRMSADEI